MNQHFSIWVCERHVISHWEVFSSVSGAGNPEKGGGLAFSNGFFFHLGLIYQPPARGAFQYFPARFSWMTQEIDLAEWYSSILKWQHKHSIAIAIYSRITVQTYCTNSHYWSLNACCRDTVCPQLPGNNMWAKFILSHLLSSELIWWVVQFLFFVWVESHTSSPPMLVWLALNWFFSGKAVHAICWLSDISATYLKQRLLSITPCVEIISAFFMTICC